MLAELEQLPQIEIAEALGIHVNTVANRLNAARSNLERLLRKRQSGLGAGGGAGAGGDGMSSQKRKPLDTAALAAASVQQPDPVHLATAGPIPERPKRAGGSRAGRVQIQGHFPEETRRALKMLAVRQDRTVEDLLGEAIAYVLAKYVPTMN